MQSTAQAVPVRLKAESEEPLFPEFAICRGLLRVAVAILRASDSGQGAFKLLQNFKNIESR